MIQISMEVYFELAEVPSDEVVKRPFMRLCLALEKKFPDIRGWQLEQIQDLCVIAINNENCFFMCEETFLKTTIFLKDPKSLFRRQFSKDELMMRITNGNDILQRQSVKCEPQITIRRNVLPRQRYWTKLREFYHRPYWTREFYTHQILKESIRERKSLTEKLKERRKQGEKCELAMSLRLTDDRDATRGRRQEVKHEPANPELMNLQSVHSKEVVPVRKLAKGGEGTVWEVVWGNCTYAMKSYKTETGPFTNEHKIAQLRPVHLHPHMVHAFGRSRCLPMDEVDSKDHPGEQPCLLMELLDGDLLRFVYEDARAGSDARSPFSRVDKLDVLLQIASAMRNLHDNNVVHGDLKLANILLSQFEVSENVQHFLAKVADFGSAKIIDSTSPFVPNGGTREYASPEVLEKRINKQNSNVSCMSPTKLDVYSFGVVAYEILTRHRAFNGELAPSKMPNVMKGEMKLIDSTEWRKLKGYRHLLHFKFFDEVITLVERCLKLDPEMRPSFSEICNELRNSKLNLQVWEKRVVASQKRFVRLFAIIVMLFIFLRYASAVWIIVVLLMVSTFLIGSWACSNFPSTLHLRNMEKREREKIE